MASNGQKIFFVLGPKDAIVFDSSDMSEALSRLHSCPSGSRLVRDDGVVLAFMTAENSARGRVTLSKKVKKQILTAARVRIARG